MFHQHPLVYSTLSDGYLEALSSFYEEFNRRIKDRRTKYDPYYLIINCANFVTEFEENKEYQSSSFNEEDFTSPRQGRINISARYNSRVENENNKVLGRDTLFEILPKIKTVSNMFVVITFPSSDIFKNHKERDIIKEFSYKIVQNNINSNIGEILHEGFRIKQLDNLNDNLVYISTGSEYSKVRFYKYNYNNIETKKLIVSSIREE